MIIINITQQKKSIKYTKKAFCLLLIRKTAKRQKQILCGWMFLMSLSAD